MMYTKRTNDMMPGICNIMFTRRTDDMMPGISNMMYNKRTNDTRVFKIFRELN